MAVLSDGTGTLGANAVHRNLNSTYTDLKLMTMKWTTPNSCFRKGMSSSATEELAAGHVGLKVDCSRLRKLTLVLLESAGMVIVDLGIIADTRVAAGASRVISTPSTEASGVDVVLFSKVAIKPIFECIRDAELATCTFMTIRGLTSLFSLLTQMELQDFYVLERDAEESLESLYLSLREVDRSVLQRERVERTARARTRVNSISVFIYDQSDTDGRTKADAVLSCYLHDASVSILRHFTPRTNFHYCEYIEVRADYSAQTGGNDTSRGVLILRIPDRFASRDVASNTFCRSLSLVLFAGRTTPKTRWCASDEVAKLCRLMPWALSAKSRPDTERTNALFTADQDGGEVPSRSPGAASSSSEGLSSGSASSAAGVEVHTNAYVESFSPSLIATSNVMQAQSCDVANHGDSFDVIFAEDEERARTCYVTGWLLSVFRQFEV